jgi:hypothetical protein
MRSKTMRAPLRATLGLTAFLGAHISAGCGSNAPTVTGLDVTVTFQGAHVDQLVFTVATPAGDALPATRRPLQAGFELLSPQRVLIYLPDALAGQTATCTVTALVGGQPLGVSGRAGATLQLHRLTPVRIDLSMNTGGDAAAPDANTGGDAAAPDVNTGGDAVAPDANTGGDVAVPDTVADSAPTDVPTDATPPDKGPGDGVALKVLGQRCGTGDECDSTLCVDGFCCGSPCGGLCEACDIPGKEGTCTPMSAGTASGTCAQQPVSSCGFDGTCDGNGGCRRYPAGIACKAATCQAGSWLPPSACDGQGICVVASPVDCAPYVCAASATPPRCLTVCQQNGTDCVAPAVCGSGSCGPRPKKANGAGCVDAADCTSAICQDGVCCATTCTGACVSCNQAGFAGTCHPVAVGKSDPHGVCKDMGTASCGSSGLCNGAGACARYAAGTVCGAGTCNGRFLRRPRSCDGLGTCQTAADVDCNPFRCDPATTACFTACTADRQCAAALGRTCVNNLCQ